jgi:aspartate racemase
VPGTERLLRGDVMKIIGLVGGTGWISTVEYYRIINEETNRRLGGLQFAECILYSLNFGDIVELQEKGKDQDLFYLLRDAARKVESIGAECIVLCANTMHRYADSVQAELSVPIIHIAEATGAAVAERGMKTVGLLGTKLTMELDFYKKKLKEADIETLVPEADNREFINRTIMKEIMKGIFNAESKERFHRIMRELHSRGAEGIILGCTEIPLLVKQEDIDLPLFDTLLIHSRAAVDFALGK